MMSIYLNINVRTQTFENIILNKINNYEIKKGCHDLYVPGLPPWNRYRSASCD